MSRNKNALRRMRKAERRERRAKEAAARQAVGGGTGRDAPSDRDDFARRFVECCRKLDGGLDLAYDPDAFVVSAKAGACRASLSNAFALYRATEEGGKQDVIGRYARAFVQGLNDPPALPRTFEEAKDRLLPVIRNRWERDIALLAGAPHGRTCALTVGMPDHLVAELVFDMPDAVAHVTTGMIETWGTSEDALFAVAIENLRRQMLDRIVRHGTRMPLDEFAALNGMTASELREAMHRPFSVFGPTPPSDGPTSEFAAGISLDALGFGVAKDYPGLFGACEDDWFCSSRMLVEEWIRVLPVRGDHVVLVPRRGSLMVTGTDDPESLVEMAKLAAGMEDCDHPVSRIPVRLAAGGWEAWQPPKGHPAHEAFARLRARETAAAYAHQGHVLRRQPGVEGFVAGCMPGVEDSGFVGTLALWTKDSDPLLPKADWIMFAVLSDDRSKMSVVPPLPWEAAQAIVGHLLEPTAHSPVRYRTKGFPSDDELQHLDRIATECRYPLLRRSPGEAKEGTP